MEKSAVCLAYYAIFHTNFAGSVEFKYFTLVWTLKPVDVYTVRFIGSLCIENLEEKNYILPVHTEVKAFVFWGVSPRFVIRITKSMCYMYICIYRPKKSGVDIFQDRQVSYLCCGSIYIYIAPMQYIVSFFICMNASNKFMFLVL